MRTVIATDGEISIRYNKESDAEILSEIDGDPEHRRRFEFPEEFVPTIEHAEGVIASWEWAYKAGHYFAFAVRRAGTGELLGGCELRPGEEGIANVSYWVHPKFRRQGIASRAVRLLASTIAPAHHIRSLELLTDHDNLASRGVAANCGFIEKEYRNGQLLHVLEKMP